PAAFSSNPIPDGLLSSAWTVMSGPMWPVRKWRSPAVVSSFRRRRTISNCSDRPIHAWAIYPYKVLPGWRRLQIWLTILRLGSRHAGPRPNLSRFACAQAGPSPDFGRRADLAGRRFGHGRAAAGAWSRSVLA